MAFNQPLPTNAPIADQQGYIDPSWYRYLFDLSTSAGAATTTYSARVNLSTQNASIGTTNIPLPTLSAGQYMVSTYARITTADGVSSSLTVGVGWTESAVSLAISGPAMTGNSITTVQSNVWMLVVDGATPISYSTTYASNTPGTMKYTLRVLVQALQ